MTDQVITIIIDPEAETVSVDTEGFHGQGCQDIHRAFEAMGPVTKEELKPEYYESNRNQNTVRVGR
jgi:hypothetical protein